MKIDLEIEKLENGYTVLLGDRKKFCRNEREITRMLLMKVMDIEPMRQHSEEHFRKLRIGEKIFHQQTIGQLQKAICEIIEKDGFSTLDKLTDELYINKSTQHKNEFKGDIKKSLIRLVKNGYLKRHNANSKKYILTKKMPKGYIEYGKKLGGKL